MSPQTTPRNSGSVMLGSGAGVLCNHGGVRVAAHRVSVCL